MGSLTSIGVIVDNDGKVKICLCGLGQSYKHFKNSIQASENIPRFVDLTSMVIIESGEDPSVHIKDKVVDNSDRIKDNDN